MNYKKAISYLAGFSILILSNACEEIDLKYSCNPDIDKFVTDHKKALSDISLDELITYDISLQRAVFNSWDFHKKQEIWLEKLYRFSKNEDLNSQEKAHVCLLIDHVVEDYFLPDNLIGSQTENHIFAEYWIDYAQNLLGWTKTYIASIIYRLYIDEEQLNEEFSSIDHLKKNILTDTELADCDCNTAEDFCDLAICDGGGCNIVTGCGWLWTRECNGNCEYN